MQGFRMTTKPRLFIGSSAESLPLAYAAQAELDRSAEVTIWTQGIFTPSGSTLPSLLRAATATDAALFVFAPDDLLRLRGTQVNAVRDNVIFEFGLFIGILGQDRVFFITPNDSSLHLPTDLLGITPLGFNAFRSDGNLQAALGPACKQIRIQLGSYKSPRTSGPPAASELGQIDDSAASEILTQWLNQGLIDVLTRPMSIPEVESRLLLPSGTLSRTIQAAVNRSTRGLTVAVNDGLRLQLVRKA